MSNQARIDGGLFMDGGAGQQSDFILDLPRDRELPRQCSLSTLHHLLWQFDIQVAKILLGSKLKGTCFTFYSLRFQNIRCISVRYLINNSSININFMSLDSYSIFLTNNCT